MARPKGSKNRRTLAIQARVDEMRAKGVDPKDYIEGVLNGGPYDEIRYKAALDLMEFYYPKLQRTEVKAEHTLKGDFGDMLTKARERAKGAGANDG